MTKHSYLFLSLFSVLCTAPAQAEPSQTAAEGTQPSQFCIVTQHAGEDAGYLATAMQSQRHYAQRHGYAHEAFLERVSGDAFTDPTRGDLNSVFGGGLYWQKVAAVQRMLEQTVQTNEGIVPRCQWVMWFDSDVVITNETVRLEDIVARYAPESAYVGAHNMQVDLLLSKEEYHPINAGVFMVRNSARGRGYVNAWAALYPLYKDSLLPEQSAMTTLSYLAKPWPCTHVGHDLGAYLHPSITIVPQRTFNSFPDFGRNLSDQSRWQPCDFVAHFAGVMHHLRAQGMLEVLATASSCEAP